MKPEAIVRRLVWAIRGILWAAIVVSLGLAVFVGGSFWGSFWAAVVLAVVMEFAFRGNPEPALNP